LELPGTWEQLDALARFFQGRDWDGDRNPDHGIALVLGPDPERVGDATFLSRAASLGQHPDHFSFLFDSEKLTPRIATAPFVEALRGLIALKSAGPLGMDRFDAGAARESFRTGNVALLIDRAERAATWSHGKPIGVAPLPGSDRVFDPSVKAWVSPPRRNEPSYLPAGGGWLVGVRGGLSATQLDAAIDFAKYLANPENSNRIRAERAFPMLPCRTSQMGQGLPDPTAAPDVDARLWSGAVSRTFAGRVVPGLRIPDAGGYLDDLAKGRAAALAGEDPQKALDQVARDWATRTQTRGPKRQLWHYRRSLNLRATSSQPPKPGT
jgi:multiple sugar transport system substrate-binding protein